MNDEQLDDALAGLRAELNIEPSPEFAAKVRQRIDQAPARSFWNVWMWTSVAATCGVAVIAGLLWMKSASGVTPVVTPNVTPTTAPSVFSAQAGTPTQTTTSTPAPSLRMTTAAATTTRTTNVAAAPKEKELEVLIAPDELLIVRHLMSEARNNMRREGPPSRMLIDPVTGELIPAKPIEIPLITVELLPATTENRGGGRQER